MLAKIAALFRPAPEAVKRVNNVFTLEEVRRAHFFNCAYRAIRACDLRGNYKARAVNHAKVVWGKHMDRASGYEMPADAERAMRDYIDLQATYQRGDNKPAPDRPWSPKVVA